MAKDYSEPELSILILDFLKETSTRDCIESVIRHVKMPYRIHYLHNGPSSYAHLLYEKYPIDVFIQTKENDGLGVGTRNLVASCFTPYFMMLQNDQIIGRDFAQIEFDAIKKKLTETDPPFVANSEQPHPTGGDYKIHHYHRQLYGSISLAGPVGGKGVYSERCHIAHTWTYKMMEVMVPLSPGGAGKYHHQIWREEQIQKYYKKMEFTHFTEWPP